LRDLPQSSFPVPASQLSVLFSAPVFVISQPLSERLLLLLVFVVLLLCDWHIFVVTVRYFVVVLMVLCFVVLWFVVLCVL